MRVVLLFGFLFSVTFCLKLEERKQRENQDFWRKKGYENLQRNLDPVINKSRAKNVILFIGDGMGIPTITATRHLKEFLGKDPDLAVDNFPFSSLSKVGHFLQKSIL